MRLTTIASLLAICLGAGCNKTAACKPRTLSVKLSCTSSLHLATASVRVIDRGSLATKDAIVSVTCPGIATGEVAFSADEIGHSLTIAFEGQSDDQRTFADHRDLTWTGDCQEIALQADRPVAIEDAGAPDAHADADADTPEVTRDLGSDSGAEVATRCLVTAPFTVFQAIPTFADPMQTGPVPINPTVARWSPDELEVYALRRVDQNESVMTSEIWIGTRNRLEDLPGGWIHPVPLYPLSRQFAPTAAREGLQLFFEGWTDSNISIYRATRTTKQDPFGSAVKVVEGGGSPYVVPSGKAIYYDVRRPGNEMEQQLDLDLFVATLSDGIPSGQQRIDSLSLFGFIDANPVVTDDELVIYFTSNRPPSTSADIWIATRESANQSFGSPTLVKELQTDTEDAPWWLSSDRCRMYTAQGLAIRSPPASP